MKKTIYFGIMKAVIKATGKAIEVVPNNPSSPLFMLKEGGMDVFKKKDLDFNDTINGYLSCKSIKQDIGNLRERIASIIMQSTSLQGYTQLPNNSIAYTFRNPEDAAKMAVSYADALINELKK